MSLSARAVGRRLFARWVGGGILRGPLGTANDAKIDAALSRLGLTRSALFSPPNEVARHRLRMAYMLSARGVDVDRATREYWPELKSADSTCASCASIRRCERWLQSPWHEDAPQVFCPNAVLFATLCSKAAQVEGEAGSPQLS